MSCRVQAASQARLVPAALAVVALMVVALQPACAPLTASPNVALPVGVRSSTTSESLYAFVPRKPLMAVYADGATPLRGPLSVLEGNETQLADGNGMAVDGDGTIYFVVYDSASSGSPIELLAFAPGSQGNVAPERVAVLKGPVLAGYAVGMALDGSGNFWISAIGKLLRYPTSASGNVKPSVSIALRLQTPDGLMPANASNVATDSAGNVYCSCHVAYRGAWASGVSEYSPEARGKFKLVRSFYDLTLPEVPPSSIAVAPLGTIYLASSLPNTGVFAYDPGTESGSVLYSRRFVTGSGTMIFSLTTDAAGRVYAASGSRVMVLAHTRKGTFTRCVSSTIAVTLNTLMATTGRC